MPDEAKQVSRFFLGAWVMVGGFLADKLGPTWWRLYWITVGALLIRYAAVLWRRLELSRLAVGIVIAASTFAALGVLGSNWRETNAVMGRQWVWFAAALIAMLGLFLWEGQHSAEKLGFLRTSSARDWFTLRHIPDLRGQRDA